MIYRIEDGIEIELDVKIMGRPKIEWEKIEIATPDPEQTTYAVGSYKFLPIEFETDEGTLNYMIAHPSSIYKLEISKTEEWQLENAYVMKDKKHLHYLIAKQTLLK